MSAAHWCFTLNNPRHQLDVTLETPSVRYAIFQIETGEEGTPHFQGYLELQRSQRLSFLQRLIPGAHFEQRRGTREQARDYCRKEEGRVEGPWEVGTWEGGQGTRSDIASFKAAIDRGDDDAKLWDDHPNLFLRYGKMLQSVRALKAPKRTWKTHVTVVYGPPGCGKSRWAAETMPNAFYKTANDSWWNGYNGEEDVILDDYKAWLPWSTLLQVLDRYPMQVPTKGGFTAFFPKRLIITTNFLPSEWYGKDEDGGRARKYPLDALTRRVDSWRAFRRMRDSAELEFKEFGNDKYEEFIQWVVNFQRSNNNNN